MGKKCSSDREKLLKFEAEGQEFPKILRSLEQFIQTVKGQNGFLTCSWRFLRSKKNRTIIIQIGKIIWIEKSAGKVRKIYFDLSIWWKLDFEKKHMLLV